jgi:hypothetical protein
LRQVSLAFDDDQVYLSTPDGFVLSGGSLAGDLRTVCQTSDSRWNQIYVFDHVLYVLLHLNYSSAQDHEMFASSDKGRTFHPVDNGLYTCSGNFCAYLVANQLVAKDNLLYANAGHGRNLLVSANGGAQWTPLSGRFEAEACYPSPFEITGRTVLMGGECSIDHPFIDRGILGKDLGSMVFADGRDADA